MSVLYHWSPTVGLTGAVVLCDLRIPPPVTLPVIVTSLPTVSAPAISARVIVAIPVTKLPVVRLPTTAMVLACIFRLDVRLLTVTLPPKFANPVVNRSPVTPIPPVTTTAPVAGLVEGVPDVNA